jgi:hypothetical protein
MAAEPFFHLWLAPSSSALPPLGQQWRGAPCPSSSSSSSRPPAPHLPPSLVPCEQGAVPLADAQQRSHGRAPWEHAGAPALPLAASSLSMVVGPTRTRVFSLTAPLPASSLLHLLSQPCRPVLARPSLCSVPKCPMAPNSLSLARHLRSSSTTPRNSSRASPIFSLVEGSPCC